MPWRNERENGVKTEERPVLWLQVEWGPGYKMHIRLNEFYAITQAEKANMEYLFASP